MVEYKRKKWHSHNMYIRGGGHCQIQRELAGQQKTVLLKYMLRPDQIGMFIYFVEHIKYEGLCKKKSTACSFILPLVHFSLVVVIHLHSMRVFCFFFFFAFFCFYFLSFIFARMFIWGCSLDVTSLYVFFFFIFYLMCSLSFDPSSSRISMRQWRLL